MHRGRSIPFATALALVVALAAGRAGAASPELRCSQTTARATAKFVKDRLRSIAECEYRRASGTLPSATVCRPQCSPVSTTPAAPCVADADCGPGTCLAVTDARTALRLAGATRRASSQIRNVCRRAPALPEIGPACDSATDAAALGECVASPLQDPDVEQLNVDTLARLVFATTAPLNDAGLVACQKAISDASRAYLNARIKTMQTCHVGVLRGKLAGPCPDAASLQATRSAGAAFEAAITAACSESQLAASSPPRLDFGFPCEQYKNVTFLRDGNTNANLVSFQDRLVRCLNDSVGATGDRLVDIGLPARETSGFAQGVAAGDATDSSVIFWTRVPDAGAPSILDVATNPGFTAGLQSVAIPAPAAGDDGTVKQEVTLLAPATEYFYRFRQTGRTSVTGRVKTAPAPASSPASLRVGWTGDANAFFRPFGVLDPVRLANLDAWFFIGDTIYGDDDRADGVVSVTKDDYYAKYRENREDGALRRILEATGTYVMWDDHEVRNDFAGTVPAFAGKMANGNYAFRRYNPIREDGGDPMKLYRSFKYGDLAEFFVIDLRQYRSAKYTCCNISAESGYVLNDSDTTCTTGELALPDAACTAALQTPGRTVLGATQLAWLQNALLTSTAKFKFIMNGPPITNLFFQPYDFWIGYPAERDALLGYILANAIPNVIWLSTDLHGVVVSHDRVSIGPSQPVPEVVGGAIGMDPIFRELPPSIVSFLPTLPSLLTQITQFDIDRFNAATVDVTAGAPAKATITFYDRSNLPIQVVEFDAP